MFANFSFGFSFNFSSATVNKLELSLFSPTNFVVKSLKVSTSFQYSTNKMFGKSGKAFVINFNYWIVVYFSHRQLMENADKIPQTWTVFVQRQFEKQRHACLNKLECSHREYHESRSRSSRMCRRKWQTLDILFQPLLETVSSMRSLRHHSWKRPD